MSVKVNDGISNISILHSVILLYRRTVSFIVLGIVLFAFDPDLLVLCQKAEHLNMADSYIFL